MTPFVQDRCGPVTFTLNPSHITSDVVKETIRKKTHADIYITKNFRWADQAKLQNYVYTKNVEISMACVNANEQIQTHLEPAEYDIVYDINSNGIYDAGIDIISGSTSYPALIVEDQGVCPDEYSAEFIRELLQDMNRNVIEGSFPKDEEGFTVAQFRLKNNSTAELAWTDPTKFIELKNFLEILNWKQSEIEWSSKLDIKWEVTGNADGQEIENGLEITIDTPTFIIKRCNIMNHKIMTNESLACYRAESFKYLVASEMGDQYSNNNLVLKQFKSSNSLVHVEEGEEFRSLELKLIVSSTY